MANAFILRMVAMILMTISVVASQSHGEPIDVKNDKIFFRAQALPGPTEMAPVAIARRAVVREFLKEHPNYEIEAFAMPSVGMSTQMDTGPLMAIAAGVPPHCIYVNFRQSSTYIGQGFLEPMEMLLARLQSANPKAREVDDDDKWLADPSEAEIASALQQLKERVQSPVWPVVYRADEHGKSDGKPHVWSLPISNLVMALIYRKDLFNDAGLDPDKPPKDWNELIDYARKLTIPEKKQYGMMAYGGSEYISWGVYAFLVSTDARAVSLDENGQWKAAFGTRGFAEAVHFIWRMAFEPWTRESDGQQITGALKLTQSGEYYFLMQRGQVGMTINYLDEEVLADLNPQLYGIAPVPLSFMGTRGSEVNCQMLGVFSSCTAKQKLGVMEFIWYFTSDDASRIRTQIYVENGMGLFVSPPLLKKFGYERLLRRVPQGWQSVFETAMTNGVPEPYGRNTQNIYRFMSEPINLGLEYLKQNPTVPAEQQIDVIEKLAKEAADRVNVDLLGTLPEEVMQKRRMTAAISLVLLGIAFSWMLISIWRYFSKVAAPVSTTQNWRKYVWGYVLIAPGMLLVLWWQYLPLVGGLQIAFQDYQLVRDSMWVGLDNFAMVLYNPRFWWGLVRTIYFVALMIGLAFWPPILLAILLQEVPTTTLKYLFRTVYYLPQVLAGVVVYFLWTQLYGPTKEGVLNQLLMQLNHLGPISATLVKFMLILLWGSLIWVLIALPIKVEEMSKPLKASLWMVGVGFIILTVVPLYRGGLGTLSHLVGIFKIEPLQWTASPELAMLCVIIPTVWASAGPGCILYLAALKTVPDDLYEAADIDGASHWHKVFYIVLPRLKYLIMIQFIASVIGAFKGGAEFVLILTGGGPQDATMLLALEIFVQTFLDLKYGIGTAMAWLLGGLLIGFTAYQLRLLSNAEFKATN